MIEVFMVSQGGSHRGCFETYQEAEKYADELASFGLHMIEIDQDTYRPTCDCKFLPTLSLPNTQD
jgi:hypothetical protein